MKCYVLRYPLPEEYPVAVQVELVFAGELRAGVGAVVAVPVLPLGLAEFRVETELA